MTNESCPDATKDKESRTFCNELTKEKREHCIRVWLLAIVSAIVTAVGVLLFMPSQTGSDIEKSWARTVLTTALGAAIGYALRGAGKGRE